MRKLTEVELHRNAVNKTTRTLVRLKHSLAADEELNRLLPDTLAEFDAAVAEGKLRGSVNIDDLLGGGR